MVQTLNDRPRVQRRYFFSFIVKRLGVTVIKEQINYFNLNVMSSRSRFSSFSSSGTLRSVFPRASRPATDSTIQLTQQSQTTTTRPSIRNGSEANSFRKTTALQPREKTSKAAARPRFAALFCWRLELLSCLGALASTIAMFTLLLKYDGKTIPDWPKYLSLNSILAIFSTTFKAMMLLPITECA